MSPQPRKTTRQTKPAEPAKPPTLDELDPDVRDALLAQARAEVQAEQPTPSRSDDGSGADLTAAIRELIPNRDHERFCPGDDRVELYEATRPPRPKEGKPAQRVAVARCIGCGGTVVFEEDRETLLATLQAQTQEATAA